MTTALPDDGLSHDDTSELTAVLTELRDEVRGLRADVVTERKGRRLTVGVGAAVVTLALVFGVGYIADLRAKSDEACEARVQSRVEVREAIGAAVDEVAAFAEVPVGERAALSGRVEARVRTELPPPSC